MYKLEFEILGKNSGNFNYLKMDKKLFLENLKPKIDQREIAKVFSPRCKFTTRISRPRGDNEEVITPWFTRSMTEADGGIITKPGVALALFNADCPVILLFDQQQGHLVLLHAGFRCLVPKEPSTQSIVSTAFQNFNLNPAALEAFISFGAGPCCYGANHLAEIYRPELAPFIERVTEGPRMGQPSFNLLALAKEQLICTACAGRENGGNGQYHSNIYEGVSAGRNLVLAWFH